jgi:hypothetical protein
MTCNTNLAEAKWGHDGGQHAAAGGRQAPGALFYPVDVVISGWPRAESVLQAPP